MLENSPIETLAKEALSYARTQKASHAEIEMRHTHTRIVSWETSAIVGAVAMAPKERITATVRVYDADGRTGVATGSSVKRGSLNALVDQAVGQAKSSTPDSNFGPASRYESGEVGLGILDRRYERIDDESRLDVVNMNVQAANGVEGAEAAAFRYTEIRMCRTVCSTGGVSRTEDSTEYILVGSVRQKGADIAIEGTVRSRHFADVGSLPLGADLARRVVTYTDAGDLPEGSVPVVLEPRVIARIMEAVLPAFDRSLVTAGESFLSEGLQVGSDKLHMIDDSLRSGGAQSRAFDVRGVPGLDLPLIREGHVGALYQGVETARGMDSRPSGHEGLKGVWPGNLLLRSGVRSRNMMYPDLGTFLRIDDLTSTGKWFDLRTGVLTLKGHFFCADGASECRYVGIRSIRTTFIDLWSAIREIGNDQQRFGMVDVSTWVVEGINVKA